MKPVITPTSDSIGARVSELSLSDMPDPDVVEFIEDALEQYGVKISQLYSDDLLMTLCQ